jgi:DNA-directed RNA polymerase subunit RPC12/RpoP
MNDKPKEAGDVVAMILVGDMPASYKVELPGEGDAADRTVNLAATGLSEEYWALAHTLDFIAGDWEDGAVYVFGRSQAETLCIWCTKAIPLTSEGRFIFCPHCGTKNDRLVEPSIETETVIYHWSREHGDCFDCGKPAAFVLTSNAEYIVCAVCAATHAADGEPIMRIEDAVHRVYLLTWEGEGGSGFFSLGTIGIPEVYERYFAEVKVWVTNQTPATKLRLVEQVVGDELTDDMVDAFFQQTDLDAVVAGTGGSVLLSTDIEVN